MGWLESEASRNPNLCSLGFNRQAGWRSVTSLRSEGLRRANRYTEISRVSQRGAYGGGMPAHLARIVTRATSSHPLSALLNASHFSRFTTIPYSLNVSTCCGRIRMTGNGHRRALG
eukprot:2266118-Pyramimonas_sp.AAC.2